MGRPRGGRHRDPAEGRRRMFLVIILAFVLSGATTSLWALDSPLQERPEAHQADSPEPDRSQSPEPTLPELQLGDAAIQTQAPEEEPTTAEPETEDTTEASSGGGNDGGGAGSGGNDGGSGSDSDRSREEQVLAIVNDERANAGCGALEPDSRLDTAARLHAEDMAANDYFSHTSPDGGSPTDRARAQGYDGGVGENIAMGYPDAASVMDGWMNSEGHRANILNCDYSVIGIGVADRGGTPYWVQNFG